MSDVTMPTIPRPYYWKVTTDGLEYRVYLYDGGTRILDQTLELEDRYPWDANISQPTNAEIIALATTMWENFKAPLVGTWKQNNYGEMVKE